MKTNLRPIAINPINNIAMYKPVPIDSCKDCSYLGREPMTRLIGYVNIPFCKKTGLVIPYSEKMIQLLNVAILMENIPTWCELEDW